MLKRSIIVLVMFFVGSQLCLADIGKLEPSDDEDQDNEYSEDAFKQYPFPEIALYPKPGVPIPGPDDNNKSCVTLDNEIVLLEPLTKNVIPDFYDDPYNAAGIWLGTAGILVRTRIFEVPVWYAIPGYATYKRFEEADRIRDTRLRIDALRRVKAAKRCFELF